MKKKTLAKVKNEITTYNGVKIKNKISSTLDEKKNSLKK